MKNQNEQKTVLMPSQMRSNIILEIQNMMFNDAVQKRDERIIQVLKDRGHVFENRQDLENFIKTRCELLRFPNKKVVLRVDGKSILEWWDTHKFEVEGDMAKVIIGDLPK